MAIFLLFLKKHDIWFWVFMVFVFSKYPTIPGCVGQTNSISTSKLMISSYKFDGYMTIDLNHITGLTYQCSSVYMKLLDLDSKNLNFISLFPFEWKEYIFDSFSSQFLWVLFKASDEIRCFRIFVEMRCLWALTVGRFSWLSTLHQNGKELQFLLQNSTILWYVCGYCRVYWFETC